MSVQTNIPQVVSLKAEIETTLGHRVETHNDFLLLVDAIESALSEHMSESTLERLWGYSTRTSRTVSVRTLNVLSRYVGRASWQDFCDWVKDSSGRESEEIKVDSIDVATLMPGTRLKLGWLPDRIITVRYIGGYRFIVQSSQNSSLEPGDNFSCFSIRPGRELYLEQFVRRDSDDFGCYVVAQNNGLTTVEII